MSPSEPIYSRENCLFAYRLHWALVMYWRFQVVDSRWLNSLRKSLRRDGIQLESHRFLKPGLSHFQISSCPDISPAQLANRVQQELQKIVWDEMPHAFKSQYRLCSLGLMSRATVESVVAAKIEAESSLDAESENGFQCLQIQQDVDLSEPQQCAQGSYWYNLYIVLEKDPASGGVQKSFHEMAHDEIIRLSSIHHYRLSRAAILRDRLDFVLGCPIETSPADVALVYLNNLAKIHFGDPVFRFQASVGTFGEEEWEFAD